jgi:peroxin-12
MLELQNPDNHRPPLFELIWADELDELIEPALRYVMAQATHRYPRYFLPLFNRFDEVFALLKTTIQYSYLREWSASFSEHFYGVKRLGDVTVKR